MEKITLMRSNIAVIAFVLFISPFSAASSAQRLGRPLLGFVRVSNGGAPPFVRIQLQQFGRTIQDIVLRESRFELLNVEEGRYTLIVDALGYQTVQLDVNVPGESPIIDLQPRRNAMPPAEAVPVWDLKIPKSARRQFEAAKSKLQENNCMAAFDYLKKAIDSYDEYGDAHRALGECYVQMNQLEAAEREFKRALEQPHKPELHLLLGRIYAQEGNAGLEARQVQLYKEEKPGR